MARAKYQEWVNDPDKRTLLSQTTSFPFYFDRIFRDFLPSKGAVKKRIVPKKERPRVCNELKVFSHALNKQIKLHENRHELF